MGLDFKIFNKFHLFRDTPHSKTEMVDDRWAKIDDAGGKYLRIVTLEDGETIHNAFFDRSFKEII